MMKGNNLLQLGICKSTSGGRKGHSHCVRKLRTVSCSLFHFKYWRAGISAKACSIPSQQLVGKHNVLVKQGHWLCNMGIYFHKWKRDRHGLEIYLMITQSFTSNSKIQLRLLFASAIFFNFSFSWTFWILTTEREGLTLSLAKCLFMLSPGF